MGVVRFAGYAAVFDHVDRAGDVIRPGAFGPDASGAVRPVPLLLQHRGAPVGTIDAIGEDARGLRVAGVVGGEVARMVRSGALRGLSVGYRPRVVRQGAARALVAVDLVEVSLVAQPMQALARIDAIGG